jgi:tRNA A37 N6-isopentenylltransferase MiaA
MVGSQIALELSKMEANTTKNMNHNVTDITNQSNAPVIVGGSALDITATSFDHTYFNNSTPGNIRESVGGFDVSYFIA